MTAVVVGIGLSSRATQVDLLAAIDDALATVARTRADVVTLATAQHRHDHPALDDLPMPIAYLPSGRFAAGEVAEPAARMAAPDGALLVPKRCTDRVCVAIVSTSPPANAG